MDDEVLPFELGHYLLTLLDGESHMGRLSPVESTVLRVHLFRTYADNGGMSHFLRYGGAELGHTLDALREVGAGPTAGILEESITFLGLTASASADEVRECLDSMDEDAYRRFESFTDRYFDECESLDGVVATYIRQHESDLLTNDR
jgi:hypothetical protein